MRGPLTPKFGALLVATFALARGVFLAVLIGPFHGPDEPAHFDLAQRIAESGALPEPEARCENFSPEVRAFVAVLVDPIAFHPERPLPDLSSWRAPAPSDPSSRATSGCGAGAFYPPAYYATVASGYALARGEGLLPRLFAARLVSVLWGVATALAAFLLGLWWFGRTWDGVLLGLVVACQPMLAFLSSIVNSDAAVLACGAGAFAAIAAARKAERPARPLAALAIVATVGALSKPTFVIYLPILFALCVAALGPWRRRGWLLTLAAFALPAAAALAWNVAMRAATANRLDGPLTELGLLPYLREHVLDVHRLWTLWMHHYWMAWGILDTHLSGGYFRAILATEIFALTGILFGWRALDRDTRGLLVLTAGGTLAAMAVIYGLELIMIRHTGEGVFVQGRYLLALFPLHAIALVVGLRSLGRLLRARIDGAWAFVGLLVALDLASVLRALGRYYV